MKKFFQPLVAASLLAALLLGSGCRLHDRGTPGEKTVNFAGIYTKTDKSFTQPTEATFPISANDIGIRDNPSGDKHTFFWGLITYTDY